MAERDPQNRTGGAVAVIGGGALLLWLLLRGRGWGLGGGGAGDGTGPAGAGANATTAAPSEARPRCRVYLHSRGIDLDGTPADLPAVVARCRAGGGADLRTSGGSSVQTIVDVIRALQAAGVPVSAEPHILGWAARKP